MQAALTPEVRRSQRRGDCARAGVMVGLAPPASPMRPWALGGQSSPQRPWWTLGVCWFQLSSAHLPPAPLWPSVSFYFSHSWAEWVSQHSTSILQSPRIPMLLEHIRGIHSFTYMLVLSGSLLKDLLIPLMTCNQRKFLNKQLSCSARNRRNKEAHVSFPGPNTWSRTPPSPIQKKTIREWRGQDMGTMTFSIL